jgi:hypothetical protein
LANDPEIIEKCDNAVLFPFGDCWVPTQEQKIHDKTKLLSIVASAKRYLPGHQLRHDVMSSIGKKMDIYGRCCNYIENKADALRDYKFNVCIENLQHPNWFTEKLIDCLRTGTVPIYWGCPNISDYFNTEGFIIVNNLNDIINELKLSIINDALYMVSHLTSLNMLSLTWGFDYVVGHRTGLLEANDMCGLPIHQGIDQAFLEACKMVHSKGFNRAVSV